MPLLRITRPPLQSSTEPPVLVMLHGLGSNEEDLMGLAQQLDPRLHLISFRAPRSYGPGYSWFDIHWDGERISYDEQQAQESLDILISETEALEAERLFIGGFSQGAAMTLALLSKMPAIAGALVLSGRMSATTELPQLDGTPVLVQHGLYDNVIPVSNGQHIEQALSAAGAEVTYREYPMGHEVSLQSLMDLSTWLSRQMQE